MNILWEIQDLRKKIKLLVSAPTITVKDGEIPVFSGTSGTKIVSSGKTANSFGGVNKATAIAYAVAL